jgi:hypothetical protein
MRGALGSCPFETGFCQWLVKSKLTLPGTKLSLDRGTYAESDWLLPKLKRLPAKSGPTQAN